VGEIPINSPHKCEGGISLPHNKKELAMSNQNGFNWDQFKHMTKGQPSYVMLKIAKYALQSVIFDMQRWNSRHLDDIMGVKGDIVAVQSKMWDDVVARQRKSGSAEIDNGEV